MLFSCRPSATSLMGNVYKKRLQSMHSNSVLLVHECEPHCAQYEYAPNNMLAVACWQPRPPARVRASFHKHSEMPTATLQNNNKLTGIGSHALLIMPQCLSNWVSLHNASHHEATLYLMALVLLRPVFLVAAQTRLGKPIQDSCLQ